jgi:hypothetical protein
MHKNKVLVSKKDSKKSENTSFTSGSSHSEHSVAQVISLNRLILLLGIIGGFFIRWFSMRNRMVRNFLLLKWLRINPVKQ